MQACGGSEVLADHVMDSRLAVTVAVSLAVSDKEIDGVLRALAIHLVDSSG